MSYKTEHIDCDISRAFYIAVSMFATNPSNVNINDHCVFGKASMDYYSLSEGDVYIMGIDTAPDSRRQGEFTNMMTLFSMLADKYSIRLSLCVDHVLVDFNLFPKYEKFGFKRISGGNEMVRLPTTCL
ncbi:MAG: hypothetical protein HRT94_03905 [Alphaproteobacteria bacterium]|nr:hypothetical protein [Alphaproteobacteria bacterium]